jgi:tetratricopeptide (TPR) repeat protein
VPSAASLTPTRPLRWQVVVLAAVAAITYANSLSGPFILDDQATIVQNTQIRDLARLGDVLAPAPDSPIAGRPLASASFALNYAIHGLDVRGYHLLNIALHAGCAVLVFLVLRRTLGLPHVPGAIALSSSQAPFGAALLWAVHPLNSEAVNYLSQRTELLMGLLYLLTLYAAIRAAGARAPARSDRSGKWTLIAVAACAAGMASKESMITAPLVVALYDRVFLFDSWPSALAARKTLYAGLASTWILAAALMSGGPRSAVVGFATGISPWVYLLNQAQMITEYLSLALWPDSLVVFYGWPVSRTFGEVAPYFVLVAGLAAATIVAWWRWPRLGFLGAWFFITLAPASSIVPIATEVGAERRMYLPLIAVIVLVVLALAAFVTLLARAFAMPPASRAARALASTPLVIAIVAAAALAAVTVARNGEYQDRLTLARTIVERRPTGVAHHILAEQLIEAGRRDEALPHLREAVAKGNSRAEYLLGRLLIDRGSHAEGAAHLEAFIRTSEVSSRLVPRWLEPPLTELVPARFALGQTLAARGEWDRAIGQAERILKVVPSHVGARGLLADAMFARQDWSGAAEHYRAYLARQPADARALINYAITQVAAENLDEAIAAFARAAELEPSNARARQLLAMAQEDRARLARER